MIRTYSVLRRDMKKICKNENVHIEMAHYAYYNLEKFDFTQIKEAKKSFKKKESHVSVCR